MFALQAPTRFDWIRGLAFAFGLGVPLLLLYVINAPEVLAFAAFGVWFSLLLDPRHGTKQQVLAIFGGMLLIIAAGALGTLLDGHLGVSIAVFVVIAFLAGQPKPEHAYLSLLTKFIAGAMLITQLGFRADMTTALAYLAGTLFAIPLCLLLAVAARNDPDRWSPANEMKRFFSGDINGPLFGLTLPLTIVAATATGMALNAEHAAWVGITVLFVMHVNDANSWQRLWQRIIGTTLGVAIAYLLVVWLPYTAFPPIIILLCLFVPTCRRQSFLWFSFLITLIVLLVIDIALIKQGGDLSLIRWRFFDTLIGCLWVAIALLLLRFGKRLRLSWNTQNKNQ